MALLDPDDEIKRATPGWAFANGFEFDSWAAIWCYECAFYDECPLLTVAFLGHIPGPWEDRNPGALNRYHCHEFKPRSDADETQEVPNESAA